MVKKRYKAQIWEVVIVVAIILIVLYRWLWLYDYIPIKYQPSTLLSKGYHQTKNALIVESVAPGIWGNIAYVMVERMNATEKYLANMDKRYAAAKEASERCQENMIFRFFMYMGEEDNTTCTKVNLKLDNALQDIKRDTRTNKETDIHTPTSVAPAEHQDTSETRGQVPQGQDTTQPATQNTTPSY